MRRRLVLSSLAIAATAVTAAPALAMQSPVTVSVSHNGTNVGVGVTTFGQPLVGAFAGTNGVCIGFSYQVPFCLNSVQ